MGKLDKSNVLDDISGIQSRVAAASVMLRSAALDMDYLVSKRSELADYIRTISETLWDIEQISRACDSELSEIFTAVRTDDFSSLTKYELACEAFKFNLVGEELSRCEDTYLSLKPSGCDGVGIISRTADDTEPYQVRLCKSCDDILVKSGVVH